MCVLWVGVGGRVFYSFVWVAVAEIKWLALLAGDNVNTHDRVPYTLLQNGRQFSSLL